MPRLSSEIIREIDFIHQDHLAFFKEKNEFIRPGPNHSEKVKDRLAALQDRVEANLGQSIIYAYPFIEIIGRLVIIKSWHVSGGVITGPDLSLNRGAVGISMQSITTKTVSLGEKRNHHSFAGHMLLNIKSLGHHFHINGDQAENVGFFVGNKICQRFLDAIPD